MIGVAGVALFRSGTDRRQRLAAAIVRHGVADVSQPPRPQWGAATFDVLAASGAGYQEDIDNIAGADCFAATHGELHGQQVPAVLWEE